MKKLSKKSILLFAAVLSLAAFVGPSMASAANWGPLSTTHAIDSANLSMNVGAIGAGSICDTTNASATVGGSASASLPISSLTFGMCRGTGAAAGCAVDATATGLPYTANGTSTTNVTISTVNVNVAFTAGCGFAGSTVNVEGSLVAGAWSAGAHSLTFTNAGSLQATSAGSPLGPVTVNGLLTDTSGTLTLS